MTVDERRKYLNLVAPRYARAGRSERSALLTEMAAVTGLPFPITQVHPDNGSEFFNYAKTNPRQLREAIYQAVERLWQHPKPAQTPNEKEAATALR